MALTPCANRYTSAIKYMATKTKKEPAKVEEKKRRKAVLKDKGILVRVTADEKEAIEKAAKKEHLAVSTWLLTVAFREIERQAKAAAK